MPHAATCGSHTAGVQLRRKAAQVDDAARLVRVSTDRQGKSGLGLEAQREAITRFAEKEGATIVAELTEIETGKGCDALDRRPVLAAALAKAKKERGAVVVAKLDRLSRDVAFIANLMATITGRAVLANTRAASRRAWAALACASGRLVRLPSFTPCALSRASAALVRSEISARSFSANAA